ncbi:MAG TPA: carboxypeptidase regulatory-like domain-containing protein [Candidatus Dormibacteraeota bacterium]|nr:carboxypeptidase regulatory-like domain-containing protein [Candidatus Dormibacteraeota bacterium]
MDQPGYEPTGAAVFDIVGSRRVRVLDRGDGRAKYRTLAVGRRALKTLASTGLLALVIAVLASVPVQAASTATITGVVTDSGTSAPIGGAQVVTQPASSTATTNSSGAYTITLAAGTYDVLITAGGYNANFVGAVNAPASGTVTANQTLTPVPANAAQDLFSRPDQSGIGTASDGHTWSNDLNVFPNATVSIVSRQLHVQNPTANSDHDTWMGIAYRDQEITGDINMVSVNGGRLLARVLGYDKWIVLALNPNNSTLTIWIDNGGNWAQIGSVFHAFSTNAWYHAKIDVIGGVAYGKAWAFGSAEPAWQVTASGIPPGLMSPGVGGFRVGGAADVYFTNFLETPITQITGKVTDAVTAAAIAGATVSLNNGATTTTDANGNYLFGGLAAGTYTVTASASGHSPGSVSATVSTGLSAFGVNLALAVPWVAGAVGAGNGLFVLHSGSASFTGDGGSLIGAPAVVAIPQTSGPASPIYIATGSDHALYVRSDTKGWQSLSGGSIYCLDNPAGAVIAGTLYVACEGGDHALWHAETQAPTGTNLPTLNISSWQSLGGAMIAGPAVGSVGGTPTYLVVGTDQHIYSRTLSTNFTRFSWAACIGHPALASFGSTSYFACHGTDDALWYATNTGSGWSASQSLGGTLVDGVGLAATSIGPVFFVEGVGGAVYHRSISTGWISDGGQVTLGVGACAL